MQSNNFFKLKNIHEIRIKKNKNIIVILLLEFIKKIVLEAKKRKLVKQITYKINQI